MAQILSTPLFSLPLSAALMFNFPMEHLNLRYSPAFDRAAIERNLQTLLVPGTLSGRDMKRHAAKLAERFRSYCACYPYGLWGPGLLVTREMRLLTELYLPMGEIRCAFEHFFAAALRFVPYRGASLIHTSEDWLDFLEQLRTVVRGVDPASLLLKLATDEEFRRRFLFANFLPARYGGAFGRYPLQESFLREWLTENRPRLIGGISCLDAACGSGEGTYELAALLVRCGFSVDSCHVRGTTLEPFELFAAAHGYFPHDLDRQAVYRAHLAVLVASGAERNIVFAREDLRRPSYPEAEKYDVIVCNGLLGGPFIHGPAELQDAVAGLAGRLRGGGILLSASRFHGGWKKAVPADLLRRIWTESGLRPLPVAEGVAGVKRGPINGDRG
jgi:SAM-dependent methyltransferase